MKPADPQPVRRPASVTRPGRTLLSPAEAVAYTGLSARTLRRYIAEGLLPAYRVGPRVLRIDLADLQKLTGVRAPYLGHH